MISKMVNYKVKEGKLEECKKAIINFVDAVKTNESNTLLYEAFQQPDGLSFVHFMAFADTEAEKLHQNTPHVKRFVDILYPNCEEEPVFTDLTLVRSTTIRSDAKL